jgi:hypothetical protein
VAVLPLEGGFHRVNTTDQNSPAYFITRVLDVRGSGRNSIKGEHAERYREANPSHTKTKPRMKCIFLIGTVISGVSVSVLGTPTTRDTHSVAIRKSTSLSTTPNSNKIPGVQKSANGTPDAPFPWVCAVASKRGAWKIELGTSQIDATQSAQRECGSGCDDLILCSNYGCVAVAESEDYIVLAQSQMYDSPTYNAIRAKDDAINDCVQLTPHPCTVSDAICSNF